MQRTGGDDDDPAVPDETRIVAIGAAAEPERATATDDDTEPDEVGDDQLPGHASTVIVPVANPATAAELLRLAIALCEYGGSVVALSITLDDAAAEASRGMSERLREVVDGVVAEPRGRRVELLSRPAPSVARGILEVTRETRADMLVLGIPVADGESTLLGPVADSIIEIAPCDVLLVRSGVTDEQVGDAHMVTITVDDDDSSRAAARTAIVLADGLDLPVEAVHVLDSGRPPWDGYAVLARTLNGVEGARDVDQRLLRGSRVAGAVLRHCGNDHLLVVGLHRETGLRRWLFGSIVTDLLQRSLGPVLVVARQTAEERSRSPIERAWDWLRPRLTDVEQETLLWQARREAGTTIDYMTLLTLSAVLATLGLIQDSVAVIIGAMLVAPLLGPLSAAAIGLVSARTPLLRRAVLTVLVGVSAGVLVAIVIGWLIPVPTATPQMRLRAAPTLLDVGVAMASGLVGAYATARKDIPAALAGVAIAAALVPPLCTVGLGVALGDPSLAGGALLLFLVNVSAVVVTGAAGFWWFGMHPVEQDRATRRRIVSAVTAAALALLVVTALVALLDASRREDIAAQDVRDALAIGDDVEIEAVEIDEGRDPIEVTVTVRSARALEPAELVDVEAGLADSLGQAVDLRLVVLQVLRPSQE